LTNANPNPNSAITQIKASSAPEGLTEVTLSPSLPAVAGDRILIGRVDPCEIAGMNGQWNILSNALGSVVIQRKWRLPETTVITPDDGTARMVTYTQRIITDWNIVAVGSRDTGRPTKVSRGRSRGVSCRH